MARSLTRQEIKPGQEIKGMVGKMSEEGLRVDLSKQVHGMCPPMHLADVSLKNPEKRFKLGSEVTGRVLSVGDHGKRRLVITLKRVRLQVVCAWSVLSMACCTLSVPLLTLQS
jgi:rRNA biogenesis protein RRP5